MTRLVVYNDEKEPNAGRMPSTYGTYPASVPHPLWVVFIRMQKTGSTSAGHAIADVFAKGPSSRSWNSSCGYGLLKCHSNGVIRRPCGDARAQAELAPSGICGALPPPRLLVKDTAHMTLRDATSGLQPHLGGRPFASAVMILTYIRDPRLRTVSEFNFCRGQNKTSPGQMCWDWKHTEEQCGKYTLLNWLKCPATSNGARNRQVRMLSVGNQTPTTDDLDRAMVTVFKQMTWFGVLDLAPLSLCLLRHYMGVVETVSWPAFKTENRTFKSSFDQLSQDEQTQLVVANALDLALWEQAKQVLVARALATGAQSCGSLARESRPLA